MGFLLIQAPLGEVITLRSVVFIHALGVTTGGVVHSSSSRMKGVWILCRYQKGRGLFIGGPESPYYGIVPI
jgi:hypothetical protein